MHIYCNFKVDIDDHESNYEKVTEYFVYTKTGIYMLYKKHFFLLDVDVKNKVVSYNDHDFLLEESKTKLNKQKLLTNIPYDYFYAKKETFKYILSDNVSFIKEIINGKFVSQFFEVHNYNNSVFETICSIMK